ncbi:LysR family transcriptional regulator [Vibrio fortis]|uniref:LysR family transcriptional regulator n=1 Tax=Vibrio fortis TaxID=212667 RepID=A0A066UJU9_9VIBR|nr:LysR family transcriptional regulator [Vibrio fortis]KDN27340.1 LysR family transcriptional regulator [Vibrio fortis]
MDKIDCIKAFVVTARLNSFTLASEELDTTQSAVSKKIAWLENNLKLTLFQRNSRKISLTPAGRDYQQYCLRLLDEMSSFEAKLTREAQSVEGEIKISAPSAFSNQVLTHALKAFMVQHPKIRINLSVSDSFVNLNDHTIDLAIRASQLSDSNLKAKLLFKNHVHYYASPDYVERLGLPETPADLINHQCLTYSLMKPSSDWSFKDSKGTETKIRVNESFSTDSPETLLNMSRLGLGICALPSWMGKEWVQQGQLIEVLQPWSHQKLPMYLLYHPSDYLPVRLRALINFLSDYFAEYAID